MLLSLPSPPDAFKQNFQTNMHTAVPKLIVWHISDSNADMKRLQQL